MPFDPVQTGQQLSQSVSAMALLNSSCQGLIETSIAPSNSPWYDVLDQELGAAENLVVGWRQSGFLYFQQEIIQAVITCGNAFVNAQAGLDTLFNQLEQNFDATLKQQIVGQLGALESPVNAMVDAIGSYSARLQQFETALATPAANMSRTVAQIQSQEADIQEQIGLINQHLADLQKQLQSDRAALAKAQADQHRGIFETIFGILLAPFTFGGSLILAGFGVATLAEAEQDIDHMQGEISSYQQQIVAAQANLTTDQQQVATLQGILISVTTAQSDISSLFSALDGLRTSWTVLLGEVQGAAAQVADAQSYSDAVVAKVFFDGACNAWQQIVVLANQLAGFSAPVPNVVTVG